MAARKKAAKKVAKKTARRSYSEDFKTKVLKYIEDGHTQAEAARRYDMHATVIMTWRRKAAGVKAAVTRKAAKKKVVKRKVRHKIAKRKADTIESLAAELSAHVDATNLLIAERRKVESQLATLIASKLDRRL